jgi:hypothetical protein
MFTWINKQGVRSDRGFVVQRTGRFSMEYTEGGKTLKLAVEDGASTSMLIDPRSMRSWYGERAEIPEVDRLRIVQNIREALEFQGANTRYLMTEACLASPAHEQNSASGECWLGNLKHPGPPLNSVLLEPDFPEEYDGRIGASKRILLERARCVIESGRSTTSNLKRISRLAKTDRLGMGPDEQYCTTCDASS